MYLALRPGRLINLSGKDFDIRCITTDFCAVRATSPADADYWHTLFEGTLEQCHQFLYSLEAEIGQVEPVFVYKPEPSAEPDEPEGSFASDDYIDDLPL